MDLTWAELFPSVVSWEFLGFVTGILSVLLLLPTKHPRLQWTNWLFSIVSAAIYLYLFREWTLYGNALLQIPFLIISIGGAWKWRGQLHGLVVNVKELPTRFAHTDVFLGITLLGLILFIPVYFVLRHWGDASPLWDGLILTTSLSAIWLQLKKYVQSWYLWIIVDLIAVPFHLSQERPATALLYFVYGLMCLGGLYTWRKLANEGTPNDVGQL